MTATVETRAMKIKQKSSPGKPLDVPKLAAIEVTAEQLKQMQADWTPICSNIGRQASGLKKKFLKKQYLYYKVACYTENINRKRNRRRNAINGQRTVSTINCITVQYI